MKNYDFKDLMAFGMFILALLTFIFQYSKQFRHRKTAPKLDRQQGGSSVLALGNPPLWAVVFFYNITYNFFFFKDSFVNSFQRNVSNIITNSLTIQLVYSLDKRKIYQRFSGGALRRPFCRASKSNEA